MAKAYRYHRAVGRSAYDCTLVAFRYDDTYGWAPDMAESWVCRVSGAELVVLRSQVGWLSDLWVSPAGRIYLSDAAGEVHVQSRPGDGRDWTTYELEPTLYGIFGIHDELVLTWGPDRAYRFDGRAWCSLEPPGSILAVHGSGADTILAVGEHGLVARLDGTSWSVLPTGFDGRIAAVHVVDSSEVYTVGQDGVLTGSVTGSWRALADQPRVGSGLAWWGGRVWVAAQTQLVSLGEDGVPRILEERLPAWRVHDAGERLLVVCEECIADTKDGETFRRLDVSGFEAETHGSRPMWKP